MQILLLGAGTVTSQLHLTLIEHGHTIAAQMPNLTPAHLDLFDFRCIVVVSPEAAIMPETLVKAAEIGKAIFIIAGTSDGLAAWANGVGLPAFAYPPSAMDTNKLLEELRKTDAGGTDTEQYRRTVLGSDMAARIQSGLSVRKIAVTSPKGGTGKTTIAVNLAVAMALSGVTTYLVDADANAGALQYHLRLDKVNNTMMGVLRREVAKTSTSSAMAQVASSGAFLKAFTPLEGLPTLKVLPGLITDDLGDEILQNEDRIREVLSGLYGVGVASGGVVIMDVGINPAHVVHRAALNLAEAIAIVIKPEIPDLAETRRWLSRMIRSLSNEVGQQSAHEFIGSRVKLCYNQVAGDGFKAAHRMLQQALQEDKVEMALVPNGVIPFVDPRLAAQAVNSDKREDVLIWRYKKERLEDLEAFSEALVGFATHFVPTVREGAVRAGLLPGGQRETKRSKIFGRK